jgi:hypothetical protein
MIGALWADTGATLSRLCFDGGSAGAYMTPEAKKVGVRA